MYEMNINYPVANLYRLPNEHVEVISQAIYGWKVKIIKKDDKFYLVETVDGYQGWINPIQMIESNTISSFPLIKITSNAAHIYKSPHVNREKPFLTLPFEVELPLLETLEEEEGRWLQIQLMNGEKGWIQKGDITLDLFSTNLEKVVDGSQQFLNLPYTWGGVSSFGYDCSGFIQMIFRQVKIILPRDASQQITFPLFQFIDWNNKERGDVIFFGSNDDSIKHVGLYLGNDQLIHASVKPKPTLQISSLEEPSLKNRFGYRTVRRLKI
ncbi:C40 family peptidase [Candidatus Protochlamydia amoebophila]|uniref:NlpC/P60 domain-containing protein n=3 Tax=Candidatus Protochlamydia amoebophila TaxID=362787 RepID=Q6MB24_PARUW|nr:C40 family peptidase [Candidatus Protochlamydia amoebophila]KIC71018.1 hypothetical protein DB44_EZ00100 [Candidatus Protochlamydia amoebophila]CAF24225.1 unnamed protein product [Candidatus Protochlamydia amoebophila UWE25]